MSDAAIQIDAEFKALIPELAADEYALLEASIQADGCRDALIVWGVILVDGHNRYAICQNHSIPFEVKQHAFESRADVKVWMLRNQLGRRNLPEPVRVKLALQLKPAVKQANEDRMLAGVKQDPQSNLIEGWTNTQIAKEAGISTGKMYQAEYVFTHAPLTIKQAYEAQEISANRAYDLTKAIEKFPPEYHDRVAKLAGDNLEKVGILERLQKSSGSPDTNGTFDELMLTDGFHYGNDMAEHLDFASAHVELIHKALDSIVRHHRRMGIDARRAAAAETPPPTGKYKCIVIDPPWPIEKIERDVRPNQGQQLDYPTMTLEQIKALPISDLAYEDGCHLYLWTTHKFLPDAFELVEAWGFHYQCLMTWVKPSGMTPYSWMYNTEHVLFARRGSLDLSRMGLKLAFEAPVTFHSEKPDVFYERVIAASVAPRLDMFARKERENFYAWGSEIGRAA